MCVITVFNSYDERFFKPEGEAMSRPRQDYHVGDEEMQKQPAVIIFPIISAAFITI
jgi:hypothetical protein